MKKLILLLLFIPLVFSCNSKESKKISKKTEFKNGRWISTIDSLSGIEIKNGKWILFYQMKGSVEADVFDFQTRIESLKGFGDEKTTLERLTLTNDRSGPFEYYVLEYSDELLSLSYIPRGNTLNYEPEKKAEDINVIPVISFGENLIEDNIEPFKALISEPIYSGQNISFFKGYWIDYPGVIALAEKVFGIPVFLSSPHPNRFPCSDCDFGYYNPLFLDKLTDSFKALSPGLKKLINPIYEMRFKIPLRRLLANKISDFNSLTVDSNIGTKNVIESIINNIENPNSALKAIESGLPDVPAETLFWIRRDYDGTSEKLLQLFELIREEMGGLEIESFLTRNDGNTWTNGFSTYTFSKDMPDYYIDLSSCDPCDTPTLECHMCGYSWMKFDINSFSFGRDYQNDFFAEYESTQFYEENDIMWSVESKSGHILDYESGKIYWLPVDSDSVEIEKIRLKNKPILDFIKLKEKEEQEAIEKDFFDYL